MSSSSRAIWCQTLAAIPVAYAEFSMGIVYGWVAPILKSLEDPASEIHPNINEASWIASLHELGRCFGPLLPALLMDVIGRNLILIVCALISFVMWFGVLFTKSVQILYAIRFILGIGIGMCDVLTSIYLAENCSPKVRGIICSLTLFCFYSAMLIQFVVASYLSYNTVAMVNLTIGFVGVMSNILLKEPVQFLLLKGKVSQAQKNFTWLRGNASWDILHTEFAAIEKNVEDEKQKKQSFKDLFSSPNNRKSLIVVVVLHILTMAVGCIAIMSYVTVIIPSTENLTSYELTICLGIIQLSATVLSSFVIERFDRRSLMKFLLFFIALIHLFTAFIYYQYKDDPSDWYPWCVLFGLGSFGFAYSMLDPVVHVTRGELFPQSIKAIGGCFTITAHAIMGFLTTKMFLIITHEYGVEINFVIFSIVSFSALVYVHLFLPEARARTLVEIQSKPL